MDADGRGWTRMDVDQFPHPETPEDGPSPFPLRESPRPCLAPSPSANPNGIMSVGMDVDQFPHPETPLVVGHRRFPSGNPQGRTLPIAPPGIPTGFCHEARGCAAAALPRVNTKDINNPNGVVPMVRMGGM